MSADLLSPVELSEYISVPVATLAQWRSTGLGGPVWLKVGRHARYRPADVETWLQSKTVKGDG